MFSLSAGSWPLREIVEAGDAEKDRFIRYMAQIYVVVEETMIKLNQERCSRERVDDEHGHKLKNTKGVVIIVDLKGYNRSQLTSLKSMNET